MSEQMDASNNDFKLKLAIKTPKEKKDILIDASSTVKQVNIFNRKKNNKIKISKIKNQKLEFGILNFGIWNLDFFFRIWNFFSKFGNFFS